MRISNILLLIALSSAVNAIPRPHESYPHNRDASLGIDLRLRSHPVSALFSTMEELWKRKGGGGRGGSGGSGSSGKGGSGSSGKGGSGSRSSGKGGSGSGSSGKGGSGSGSSGKGGSGSGSSGKGGSSSSGSSTKSTPSFGEHYFKGGSPKSYSSGGCSPSGISPSYYHGYSFFPGFRTVPVYAYPYTSPYTFYNETASENQTKPVTCLCQADAECSCDDNSDSAFIHDLIGNGSYASLDKTVVTAANVNGTDTILINGTLPIGTADANGASMLALKGYWVMAALVGFTVFLV